MGYKEIPSESLERFTHVIFDEEAYFSTLDEIKRLKEQIGVFHQQVGELREQYENLKERANDKIREIRKEEQAATQQCEEFKRSNKELSQIVKDRSNSMRKIPNKKKHSGYLLLSMEQLLYGFRCKGGKMEHLPCWRLRFQTPYMITMHLDTVQERADFDMEYKLKNRLGIKEILYETYIEESYSRDVEKKVKEDKIILLQTQYKGNGVRGFWETEILLNKFVVVPPELTLPFSEEEIK